jgi:hypothetical protein
MNDYSGLEIYIYFNYILLCEDYDRKLEFEYNPLPKYDRHGFVIFSHPKALERSRVYSIELYRKMDIKLIDEDIPKNVNYLNYKDIKLRFQMLGERCPEYKEELKYLLSVKPYKRI